MATPETADGPPTPTQLKELQGFAGEFNWLATRTRTDLSYLTSVIASAATKYANWSLQLCKKGVRYLAGTVDAKLRLTRTGNSRELATWSDAGFAGISTNLRQAW